MTEHLRTHVDPATRATLTRLAAHSCSVIVGNQHHSGAYPAAPTFSAYSGYAWLRDGSFTAEAMSRYGDTASVERFHDWTAAVLLRREAEVEAIIEDLDAGRDVPVERLLPTRFTLDGDNGSAPWWDFQSDGYGMWLWAVVTHADRHGVPLQRWARAMAVAVDYVCAVWDRACYDWWEEHVEHRHVSTLGALWAGLRAAAESGVLDSAREVKAVRAAEGVRELVLQEGVVAGRAADPASPHLSKWLGSGEVDSSLAACMVPFGMVAPGSPLGQATLEAIVRDLDVGGGVHRFRDDVFYGGGQWVLLACLLGWNRVTAGDHAAGLRHLLWAAGRARPGGDLPEQVPDHLLHPEHHAEWVARWGPVATPLLWSHAMFVILSDELGLLPGRDR